MKKILCFGDSNTYGFNPKDGTRYTKSIRWTSILAKNLGEEYEIIEAGLNNRNCFILSQNGTDFVGYKAIEKYINQDLRLIIFALGINDLQIQYNPSLNDFKTGLKYTLNLIKDKKKILLCPPKLSKDILYGSFANQFNADSIEKSEKLPEIYKEAAKVTNAEFVDLNMIVKVSKIDGLHLDPMSHKKIADFLTDKVKIMTRDIKLKKV